MTYRRTRRARRNTARGRPPTPSVKRLEHPPTRASPPKTGLRRQPPARHRSLRIL